MYFFVLKIIFFFTDLKLQNIKQIILRYGYYSISKFKSLKIKKNVLVCYDKKKDFINKSANINYLDFNFYRYK